MKLRACENKIGSNFVSISPEERELFLKRQQQKSENQKKQLGDAEQVVAKQKSKKSKITKLLTLLINIVIVAVILVVQLKSEGIVSVSDLLQNKIHYGFLVLTLVFYVFFMFLKAFRFNLLIKNSPHKRSRPFLSYKLAALGKYYDAITPMATGEQPFQIFYLNKRGMDASTAISVPIAKYILSQFAWMAISLFAVIYSLAFDTLRDSRVVLVIALVSFALNSLLVGTVLIASFSKKVGKIAVARVLKFLEKIKIVKNYEKQYAKVIKIIDEYQQALKNYIKNLPVLFFTFFLSVFTSFINYSILFFIYGTLVRFDPSLYWEIIVKAIMIDIASGLIPLPGGTGMSEISFSVLFASIFTSGTLFWAIILWRFINFYGMILQGFGIIIYDYFVGNKKYEWQKIKWELEAESIEFRNKRLEEYRLKKRRSKNKSV